MKLKKILEKVEYECVQGSADTEVADIVYDSRKADGTNAFVCLCGAMADGHQYIKSAYDKGCRVFITQKESEQTKGLEDITIIRLEDTRKSLSYLSASLFDYPAKKLTTIALTGTKGKTATAFMIKNILEKAGIKTGMIGTMGVFFGKEHYQTKNTTPESYDIQYYMNEMVKAGCTHLVMEVSSQALKVGRTRGVLFDYGLFTNLSPDHIGEGEHADFEEYVYCKSLLFRQCRHGIFNIDDEHAPVMMKDCTCDIHTFGIENKSADLVCEQMEFLMESGFIGIDFKTKGLLEGTIKVNTPGKFSVYNGIAAMLTAHLEGVKLSDMQKALLETSVRGRVEPVKISSQFNLLIDYAHNGMSMESLLTTLQEYKPNRIVSLFGCGGNRSKLRRYEMGEISGKYSDFSILTADNSRYEKVEDIIEDIKVGMKKTDGEYVVIPDRREAIKYSIANAKEGDIVLLLGKGHEDYQEINGERFPFDERVVIQEVLEELEREGKTWLK